MSDSKRPPVGEIGWTDLTVDEAGELRDFYSQVVGWTHEGLDMGGYEDFVMKTPEGKGVAGICYRRGTNKDIPPHWMVYITVEDLDRSVRRCERMGGTVLVPAKDMGANGRFCIIRDPAGAVAALYQAP